MCVWLVPFSLYFYQQYTFVQFIGGLAWRLFNKYNYFFIFHLYHFVCLSIMSKKCVFFFRWFEQIFEITLSVIQRSLIQFISSMRSLVGWENWIPIDSSLCMCLRAQNSWMRLSNLKSVFFSFEFFILNKCINK